jgi:hypothetical protein
VLEFRWILDLKIVTGKVLEYEILR